MKLTVFIFSCLAVMFAFLTFGFSMSKKEPSSISKGEQAVNKLLGEGTRTLGKKYRLHPCGTHVGMPGGPVQFLGLHFQVCGPWPKKKLRKILIDSSQEWLNMINTDEELRPYLAKYPFTLEDTEIVLFICSSTWDDLEHPDIAIADVAKGRLRYITFNRERNIPEEESEEKESYEEALEILQKENQE